MYLLPLLILFVLLYGLFANRSTRDCRWRERRSATHSDWTCLQCGAKTTGPRATTPKTCLRS